MFIKKLISLMVGACLLLVGCIPEAPALETSRVLPTQIKISSWPTPTAPLPTATATPRPVPDWLLDVGSLVEDLATRGEFSGVVLVAKDGDILLAASYGLADRELEIPNQIDTKFNLGSINKMFTAVAILQLMEAGKLSLDDTIQLHFPDYPNQEVAAQITIHQLLTHTSGLGDIFTRQFMAAPHKFRSNADFLPLFVNKGLLFQPGEKFSYSNAGYVVLGLIIERVTGLSYDDYIQQNIFDPCSMTSSGNYYVDETVPDMAVGYTSVDLRMRKTGVITSNAPLLPGRGFAAGGGYSNVSDLLSFSTALMNFKLLSPATTELAINGKVRTQNDSQYAYGFIDKLVAGQRVVGHTGGMPGVCSFLDIYIDSGYTIIGLSNSENTCSQVQDFMKDKTLQ